jgi:hypothetical protein
MMTNIEIAVAGMIQVAVNFAPVVAVVIFCLVAERTKRGAR